MAGSLGSIKCGDCGGRHEVSTNSGGLLVVRERCPGPPEEQSSTCCGCGIIHNTRNSDNSLSAFCDDECYNRTMTNIVDSEEEDRVISDLPF